MLRKRSLTAVSFGSGPGIEYIGQQSAKCRRSAGSLSFRKVAIRLR